MTAREHRIDGRLRTWRREHPVRQMVKLQLLTAPFPCSAHRADSLYARGTTQTGQSGEEVSYRSVLRSISSADARPYRSVLDHTD